MNDEQLLRYSRQLMLPQVDVVGQEKLLAARVLIVGLGGLGSPVAMYLAASGVGHLVLNDYDKVDLSNLQRQIVHGSSAVGKMKTTSAKACLQELNADCEVTEIPAELDDGQLDGHIGAVDVVVDCSDNYLTRNRLNAACVKKRKPLVSGAAIRFEGQITVFHNQSGEDACYQCLYPELGEEQESCSETGVISPLVGVVGSIQALEVLKLIAQAGDTLRNRLMLYDGLTQNFRVIRYSKDPVCPVCS